MSKVEFYKTSFSNFNILDCVIEKKDRFYFVAIEAGDATTDPGPSASKRAIKVDLSNADKPEVKHVALTNFYYPIHIGMSLEAEAKPIVMDNLSNAWVNNPGTNGLENALPGKHDGGILVGAVKRVKSLGNFAICCTGNRGVMIRQGVRKWQRLGQEIPIDVESKYCGFSDFDAFSMDDIYAVGGHGDVWHFDGKSWTQCDFPSNYGPSAVCCAGDGFVYIGLGGGCVYKGRGDDWRQIHKDHMTLPFKDIVWFNNKVWCSSDFGIWTIENDTLCEASVPSHAKLCAGNLSTREGTLLVAGQGGAAYCQANAWHPLFNRSQLSA